MVPLKTTIGFFLFSIMPILCMDSSFNLTKALFQAAYDSDCIKIRTILRVNPSLVDSLNEHGIHIVHYVVEHSSLTSLRELFLCGAKVDVRSSEYCCQFTPLHTAVDLGHLDKACFLLDKKANPNVHCAWGDTPLHFVKAGDDCEWFIKLLVERGADVNARNEKQETPLHIMTAHNNNAGILELLKHGADVNARNKKQETPLHIMTAHNNNAGILELWKRGADINMVDSMGQNILHKAVIAHNVTLIAFLTSYGADAHQKDNQDKTPLDRAWALSWKSCHPNIKTKIIEYLDCQ